MPCSKGHSSVTFSLFISQISSDVKHEVLLREMQRMFCFLMVSPLFGRLIKTTFKSRVSMNNVLVFVPRLVTSANSGEALVLGPRRTQRITWSAVWFPFDLYGKSAMAFLTGQSWPLLKSWYTAELKAQNKDFGTGSQTDLPEVWFCLWRWL